MSIEKDGAATDLAPANVSPAAELEVVTDGLAWDVEDSSGLASTNPEVKQILAKAANLARDLNHRECHLAHLMLAITLFPGARDRLCGPPFNYDAVKVRESAWRELAMIGILNDTPKHIGVSKDLRDIHDQVQELVRNSQDASQRTIHVKDLIESIAAGSLGVKIRDIYGGNPTVPTAEQTRVSVRDTKWSIDQHLPRIQNWLGDVRIVLRGPNALSTLPEARPLGLVQTIDAIRREQTDASQALNARVSHIETAAAHIERSQAALERKLQTVRHLVVATLCLAAASAAFVALLSGTVAWIRLL